MADALDGITVADFTQLKLGPWATQKLAEMGANVIKIEPPWGDSWRGIPMAGKFLNGASPSFLSFNRSKRSIVLDLKSEEGIEVAREIIREADVLTENFRAGVMEGLGLGYEDLREINPGLVYVSATGYGPDGPYADRPGQDLLLQSMSGLAANGGRADDPPTTAPTAVVDEHTGMLFAFHIMTALFHRERTGTGQRVEINMLDAALDLQHEEIFIDLNVDADFERSEAGIAYPYGAAPYGIYEVEDGHVAISFAPLDDLEDVLGIEGLGEYANPTDAYEHRDELKRRIEERTREYTTEELMDTLLEADLWCAEVGGYEDLPDNPQVQHNGMLVDMEHPQAGSVTTTNHPASLSETPGEIRSPPPLLGEHTEEILAEVGYDESEIDRLAESGVTTPADEDA